jgi:hypothetical protein
LYNGDYGDYEDLDVKKKYLKMVRDETEKTENKSYIGYFQGEDELYPMETYSG